MRHIQDTFLPLLRSFGQNTRGGIMVAFALIFVTVLTGIGASVDLARTLTARASLRSAADSAALAAASMYLVSNSERVSAAHKIMLSNIESQVDHTVAPTITVNGDIVTVVLATDVPTTLMRVINVHKVPISVTARAKIVAGPPTCMLVLNPSEKGSVSATGTSTTDFTGCNVMNNSSHPTAYHGNSGALMKAGQFCGVGGHDNKNSYIPAPKSGCKPIPDPYASLPHPVTGGCDHVNKHVNKATTLFPGIYCGGLNITANTKTVTLSPGTYIIKDGPLNINSGKIFGTGITFYFVGTNTEFNIRTGNEFVVSAPTTGTYAGILFFQKSNSNPRTTVTVQGGGILNMTGVMYIPTWTLEVTGGGEINKTSPLFAIVADKIRMSGNGIIYAKSDWAAAGIPDILPRLRGSTQLVY